METFSALLALCEGNPPVNAGIVGGGYRNGHVCPSFHHLFKASDAEFDVFFNLPE